MKKYDNLSTTVGALTIVSMLQQPVMAAQKSIAETINADIPDYSETEKQTQQILVTDEYYQSELFQLFESRFLSSLFSIPKSFLTIQSELENIRNAGENIINGDGIQDLNHFPDSFKTRLSNKGIDIGEYMGKLKEDTLENMDRELNNKVLEYIRNNQTDLDEVVKLSFGYLLTGNSMLNNSEIEKFRTFYEGFVKDYGDFPNVYKINEMRVRYGGEVFGEIANIIGMDEEQLIEIVGSSEKSLEQFSEEQKNLIIEEIKKLKGSYIGLFKDFVDENGNLKLPEGGLTDYQMSIVDSNKLFQDVNGAISVFEIFNPSEAAKARQFIRGASMIHKGVLALTQNGATIGTMAALGAISGGLGLMLAVGSMMSSQEGNSSQVILDAIGAVLDNQKLMLEKLDEINAGIHHIKIKLWEIENKLILLSDGQLNIIESFGQKMDELEDRLTIMLRQIQVNQAVNKIDEYSSDYSTAIDILKNEGRYNNIGEMVIQYRSGKRDFTDEEKEYIIDMISQLDNILSNLTHAVTDTSRIATFNDSGKFTDHTLDLMDVIPERVAQLLYDVGKYLNLESHNHDFGNEKYNSILLDLEKFRYLGNPGVVTDFTLKMLDIILLQNINNPTNPNRNIENVGLEVLKTWEAVQEVQRGVGVSKMLYSAMLRRVLQDLEKIKNDDVIDLGIRSTSFPLQPSGKEIQNHVNRMEITQIVNHSYIRELIEKGVIEEIIEYDIPSNRLIGSRTGKYNIYKESNPDCGVLENRVGGGCAPSPRYYKVGEGWEIDTTFTIGMIFYYKIGEHKIPIERHEMQIVVKMKNGDKKNLISNVRSFLENSKESGKYEDVGINDNESNKLDASKGILAREIIKYIMEKLSASLRLSSEIQELDKSLIALNLILKAAYGDLIYTHPELKKINSILTEAGSIDSRDIRSVSNRVQLERMIDKVGKLITLVESIPDNLPDRRDYGHKGFGQISRAVDAIREVQKYPQFRFESLDGL